MALDTRIQVQDRPKRVACNIGAVGRTLLEVSHMNSGLVLLFFLNCRYWYYVSVDERLAQHIFFALWFTRRLLSMTYFG